MCPVDKKRSPDSRQPENNIGHTSMAGALTCRSEGALDLMMRRPDRNGLAGIANSSNSLGLKFDFQRNRMYTPTSEEVVMVVGGGHSFLVSGEWRTFR